MFVPGIDEDVEMVPETPTSNFVALDDAFTDTDYELAEAETALAKRSSADDAAVIVMELPKGKRVKVSKRQLQSCRTPQELMALDRSLYVAAGLDPSAYGL